MSAKKVKIGSFLTERKTRYKPDEANELGLRRVNKIDFSGTIHLVEHKPTRTNMILVKKGDLLISGINAEKGGVAVYEYEEDAIATIHYSSYLYDAEKIEVEYLKWFLKSNTFKNILIEQAGSGIKSELKPNRFLPLEIDLPTLSEQKGILQKLESVNSEIEELHEIVEQNEKLISKLRQSILQDAVQGKLTEKWRKQNPKIESAAELLKHIDIEKERLIEEKEIKKEKPFPIIKKADIPFDLPVSWEWCRFGEVIKFMAYGTSQKTNDNTSDVPVLRMGNITTEGLLKFENLKYISPNHRDLPKLYLEDGDLVFNRTNSFELVGKSAVYNDGNKKYTLASYLIKVSPFIDFVNSYYLNNYIISPICRKTQIEPQITAQTNQANFSGSKLKNILLPLPPIEEQFEIVSKVNELNEHCNNLEIQIENNKSTTELLMQSVLSELLGEENSISIKNDLKEKKQIVSKRKIKYDSKTTYMELVKLLEEHGKLHAEELWKMSEFPNDIDAFYAELKKQIEEEKTIKEAEKGYLELA